MRGSVDKTPSIDEQRAFFDRWNSETRRVDFDHLPRPIQRQSLMVVDMLRAINLPGATILEVGCGTGWLTQRLATIGKVTAIDLSPIAIEVARSRGLQAELIVGDFYEHDFGRLTFDIALCVETLFYVTDQTRFVERLASLVKPGGFLAVTTINKFVYDRWSDVPPPGRGQIRKWLTRREVKQLLSTHFEVLTTATVEPRGDLGLLRVVNSTKVNALLEHIWSRETLKRLKERLGLGAGVVILGRKPL
jgi:SAM-dependent methyltransferase